MCARVCVCICLHETKNQVMNLSENKREFIGRVRKTKGKGENDAIML